MQGPGECKIHSGCDGSLGRRPGTSAIVPTLSCTSSTGDPPQFFLELWAEINRKAALRSRAVAIASLPDPKGSDDNIPEGTIFEELVTQYHKLVTRAEDMIVHTMAGEVEAGLKPHFSGGGSS